MTPTLLTPYRHRVIYNAMGKTLAEHAAAYRTRRAAKIERMHTALTEILTKLDGNDKSLAVEIREIANQGLSK